MRTNIVHNNFPYPYPFDYFSTYSDYKEMGVLDDYDQNLLDERDYAPMDFDARRAVEAELAERDRREGRRTGRLGAAQESDEGK